MRGTSVTSTLLKEPAASTNSTPSRGDASLMLFRGAYGYQQRYGYRVRVTFISDRILSTLPKLRSAFFLISMNPEWFRKLRSLKKGCPSTTIWACIAWMGMHCMDGWACIAWMDGHALHGWMGMHCMDGHALRRRACP